MRGAVRGWPTVIALVCWACGSSSEGLSYTAIDSAGVSIVESIRPTNAVAEWSELVGPPALALGVFEGNPAQEFGRVIDVALLEDGGVAILDAVHRQVRLFERDGTVRSVFGNEGEGPGEFRSPRSIQGIEEEIVVFDGRTGRLTWIDSRGRLLRVHTLRDAELDRPPSRATLLNDSLVLTQNPTFRERAQIRGSGGASLEAFFGSTRTIGLDGQVKKVFSAGLSDELISVGSMILEPRFPNREYATGGGDRIFLGHSSRFEVQVFGLDGDLEALLRYPSGESPLSEGEVERVRDSIRALSVEAASPFMEELFDPAFQPEVRPVFQEFLVDPRGFLWVPRWEPAEISPSVWWVFAPGGHLVREVRMPPRTWLVEVGEGEVAVKRVDDAGVETVEIRTLVQVP